MWCAYRDIIARCGPPLWWDEHAVPRYVEFQPHECSDIYAQACCLMLIQCQGCEAEFKVCISEGPYDKMRNGFSLEQLVQKEVIHFGDPPNTDCCPAGATMNSEPVRILEFWDRTEEHALHGEYVRRPELELTLAPDWADED